jgi:hypothetical protein
MPKFIAIITIEIDEIDAAGADCKVDDILFEGLKNNDKYAKLTKVAIEKKEA